MTIDEIRALIAQKIAGQGTMVDAGGGLPAILNALCDAIAAIPAPPAPYVLPTASAETLGGIKVGDGLQISEGGVLSNGLIFNADAMGLNAGDVLSASQKALFMSASVFVYLNRVFTRVDMKDAWEYIHQNGASIDSQMQLPIFGFDVTYIAGAITGGNFIYYTEGEETFRESEV